MQMKELLETQDFEELMAEVRWPARRAVAYRRVRPVARRVPAPVRRFTPVPITPQVKCLPARCPPCPAPAPCPHPKPNQPQVGSLSKGPISARQAPVPKSEIIKPPSPPRSNRPATATGSEPRGTWA